MYVNALSCVNRYQYEDESGNPYYFDRLTNKTQYRVPTDAPIRHWTEDLRDAYDAEHGAGAYDAMMAEQAFRKQVNEQGGWYDENGEWVAATGYYDEQGEWYVDGSLPCTMHEGNSLCYVCLLWLCSLGWRTKATTTSMVCTASTPKSPVISVSWCNVSSMYICNYCVIGRSVKSIAVAFPRHKLQAFRTSIYKFTQ
jgi:hypothetical protein